MVEGLENAPEAFNQLLVGGNFGKVVVKVEWSKHWPTVYMRSPGHQSMDVWYILRKPIMRIRDAPCRFRPHKQIDNQVAFFQPWSQKLFLTGPKLTQQ
jgi:hypothetical protein